MITVSVVSHGHGSMVVRLAEQLLSLPQVSSIIVTLNIPEELELPRDRRVHVIRNAVPQGFGANHNAAFLLCDSPFYCVANPDIEIVGNPFPSLLQVLQDSDAAMVAPLVRGAKGQLEDSWRRYPSPLSLGLKIIGLHDGTYPGATLEAIFEPDWVAGMFLLFTAEDYRAVEGFDESFFLYYEDVDICARLHGRGRKVIGCSQAVVVHKAQRASRRDRRHFRYHLISVWQYFVCDWRRIFPAVLRRRARALNRIDQGERFGRSG